MPGLFSHRDDLPAPLSVEVNLGRRSAHRASSLRLGRTSATVSGATCRPILRRARSAATRSSTPRTTTSLRQERPRCSRRSRANAARPPASDASTASERTGSNARNGHGRGRPV
jgi:hypothetical protein